METSLEELHRLREQYVPRGVFGTVNAFLRRGHGAVVEDVEGKRYIDFAGGIGCLNVGHTPDRVVRAVQEQAQAFLHSCMHVMWYEPYVQVARKLAQITPGDFPKKTLLVNSGAEAVENAVKIARAYTKRRAVIAFEHGFHGRTMMALTLTSKVHPYKSGFGPFAPEVYRAPFPYVYRHPSAPDDRACAKEALERFYGLFRTTVDLHDVAAVIMEPVAGEGGFLPAPVDFFRGVAEFCKENGIVFIADEVQTGFGRTGRLFACEHYGVEPDLITLAKSLAAGLPLGAVVGRREIMDAPVVGGIGGTFGGNPLACAAALQVIDMVTTPEFLSRAQVVGDALRRRLNEMAQRFALIGDVRGLGAMLAVELVRDRRTKEPAAAETAAVLREAHERGLILLKAGTYDNVIRILCPLVIEDGVLQEGLDILEAAIASVECCRAAV